MKKIVLINNTPDLIYNSFIFKTISELEYILDDYIYIYYGLTEISEKYTNINFFSNKVTENVYWCQSNEELNDLITEIIFDDEFETKVVYNSHTFDSGFYFTEGNKIYILHNEELYYANGDYLNTFSVQLTLNDFKTYNDIKPKLSCLGLIADCYSENEFKKLLVNHKNIYLFLSFLKMIDEEKVNELELSVNQNILKVEEYLNEINYVDYLNLNLADQYELHYENLDFYYEHNGFKNKTGRIFQTGIQNFPIQNLPLIQRDVIEAPDGFNLFEIDFKAFEFFILLQVIDANLDFKIDPHIKSFNDFIGIELEDNDKKREIGKLINYGLIYGSNPLTLYGEICSEFDEYNYSKKIDKEQFVKKAEELIFNKIKIFKEKLKLQWEENGYILNYFGRKIRSEKDFTLLNYYVQSTACDIFNFKFVKIISLLKKTNSKILIQKFDSMLICLENKLIKEDILRQIDLILYEKEGEIISKYDISYGKNWKNLKKINN